MTGKEMVDAYLADKPIGHKFIWSDVPGAEGREAQKKVSSHLSFLHLRAGKLRVCEKRGNTYVFEIMGSKSVPLVHRRSKAERAQIPLSFVAPRAVVSTPISSAPPRLDELAQSFIQAIPTKMLWSELTRRKQRGIEI